MASQVGPLRSGSLPLHDVSRPHLLVLGWGRNDCGQLGTIPPAPVMPPPPSSSQQQLLAGISVPQATASAVGAASSYPPAGGVAATQQLLPGVVPSPTLLPAWEGYDLAHLSCSLYNTAGLTSDGELYVLGANDSAQLARRPAPASPPSSTAAAMEAEGGAGAAGSTFDFSGSAVDFSQTPVRVGALEPYPLADVASGAAHEVAVTQQGRVATWGDNEYGQLGNGGQSQSQTSAFQYQPKLLRSTAAIGSSNGAVSAAAAGAAARGGMASPGPGSRSASPAVSQPGQTSGSPGGATPQSNTQLHYVRAACGSNVSLALTSNGQVFSWGEGSFGALGQLPAPPPPSSTAPKGSTPTQQQQQQPTGSTVNLGVGGTGSTAVVALGDCDNSGVPRSVQGLWGVGVVQISAGEVHCAALTISGTVYCWGRGKYGALGLGDFNNRPYPQRVASLGAGVTGVQVVCGGDHTLLLADVATPTPAAAPGLGAAGSTSAVAAAAAGAVAPALPAAAAAPAGAAAGINSSSSSAMEGLRLRQQHQQLQGVVTRRVVLAWGRGSSGATGLGSTDHVCRPNVVQALEGRHVVQLAAGRQHSLALAGDGSMWSWGAGDQGQLGLGCLTSQPQSFSSQTGETDGCGEQPMEVDGVLLPCQKLAPQEVPLLLQHLPPGSRILYIAAGGDHSMAVAEAPAAGSTSCTAGSSRAAPAPSLTAIDEAVAGVVESNSGEHSQPMDVDQPEAIPAAVGARLGSTGSTVGGSVGRSSSRSGSGQQHGPDPKRSKHGSNMMPVQLPDIFDLAAAAAAEHQQQQQQQQQPMSPRLLGGTLGSGRSSPTAAANATPPAAAALASAVFDLFSNMGYLLHVLRSTQDTKSLSSQTNALTTASTGNPAPQQQQAVPATLLGTTTTTSSSNSSLSGFDPSVPRSNIDQGLTNQLYTAVIKTYVPEAIAALGAAVLRLMQEVPSSADWGSGCSMPVVQLLLVLLQNPLNSESHGIGATLLALLTSLLLGLNRGGITLITHWLGVELPPEILGGVVLRPYQRLISKLADQNPRLGHHRGDILGLARVVDILYVANQLGGGRIPYTRFANPDLSKSADLVQEWFKWIQSSPIVRMQQALKKLLTQQQSHLLTLHRAQEATSTLVNDGGRSTWPTVDQMRGLPAGSMPCLALVEGRVPGAAISSLCDVPCLLTPEAKSWVLREEARVQQQQVMHASAMSALLEGLHPGVNLVLEIRVRRGREMQDALAQIQAHAEGDLKKPLKVVFLSEDGTLAEEGVDQGGVSREFFQVLTSQLFAPDYGMFLESEDSRAVWFNPASLESREAFELVGVVLGLAIYNGIILDCHLPPVTYKKLMGEVPTLEDLAAVSPTLYKGLQQLLEYDGDVEATFCRSFEAEYEAFGTVKRVDLVKDGGQIPVNNTNRQQYAAAYAAWYLGSSCAEQFAALAAGFYKVCGAPALSLFRSDEVELLVCGLPHLDFSALRRAASYEGGYSPDTPLIKNLWEVLLELPLELKRKFLQFVTGCDRAPVAGLGALRLLIQRASADSDALPTAHTCVYTLLLPEYSSKEKLTQKLLVAIRNAQGFGLQ